MTELSIIAGILIVLVLGGLGVWGVRRYLYIQSIKKLGWQFETSPGEHVTYGLNTPPFGIGYGRSVDDYIAGSVSTGAPFRSFAYSAPGFKGRIAAIGLTIVQPSAFIASPQSMRVGASGYSAGEIGPLEVIAPDLSYASTLRQSVGAQVEAAYAKLPALNLSVDGQWLVATHAPRKVSELHDMLEAIAPIARAIETGPTSHIAGPLVPSEMSFYGRPDWVYRTRDDSALQLVTVTWSGEDHQGRDVVYAANDGLPMVALNHHWTTRRTEYYSDARGERHSRIVHDPHQEMAVEIQLPFPFLNIGINQAPSVGQKVRFESIDFDKHFTVRCPNPKFASDVIHPQMMEFMLAYQPASFHIQNGIMRFYMGANAPEYLMHCADFAHAFFARVPSFVWKDLGVAQPPKFRPVNGFAVEI